MKFKWDNQYHLMQETNHLLKYYQSKILWCNMKKRMMREINKENNRKLEMDNLMRKGMQVFKQEAVLTLIWQKQKIKELLLLNQTLKEVK